MERQGLKPDMGTDRRPRHSACTQAQCLRPATHVECRELWLGVVSGVHSIFVPKFSASMTPMTL